MGKSTQFGLPVFLLLAACSGGNGSDQVTSSGTGTGLGTVTVALTDAPACGMREVGVTVNRVRLHQQPDASSDAQSWVTVPVDPPKVVNLLDLQNGLVDSLGQVDLPAGNYQSVELSLEANRKGELPANWVVRNDDPGNTRLAVNLADSSAADGSQDLLVHSAMSLAVVANRSAELIIDFDACRSLLAAGSDAAWLLKPQLTPVPVDPAGKLELAGELGADGAGAVVHAQVQDASGQPRTIKSTVANADGVYVLSPLPDVDGRNIAVVIVKAARPVHIISDVPVIAGTMTRIPRLQLAWSAQNPVVTGLALGTVTLPADSTDTGEVSLIQQLGTLAIEVLRVNTDTSDGGYTLDIPVDPPQLSRYDPGALEFVAVGIAPNAPGSPSYVLKAAARQATATFRLVPLDPADSGKAVRVDFDLRDVVVQP